MIIIIIKYILKYNKEQKFTVNTAALEVLICSYSVLPLLIHRFITYCHGVMYNDLFTC